MRRSTRLPLLAAAAALCATPALADDIYRWTDSEGQVHYTNDASTVPANQKVEKTKGAELTVIQVKGSEPASVSSGGNGSSAEDAKAPAKQGDEPKSDEEIWRERFRKAREEVTKLQREVDADRATLADPAGHGIGVVYNSAHTVVPNPELDRVREHLAKTERELEQARRKLDDLDREASRHAIPRDWRK